MHLGSETSCSATIFTGRGCYDGGISPNLYARGCDSSTCVDDLAFIEQLLDAVEGVLCVNRRRVHATGFSNGAMMVREMSCGLRSWRC